ncbi:MAG: trehalose-phosphatase [Methyloceanibacter sp.]
MPNVSADAAVFLDFDGTLVEIADRPELVEVEPRTRRLLEDLSARFGGAVAIVTGRPLEVIDAFLAPLKLPVAAEHGSVRRDATGRVHTEPSDPKAMDRVAARLAPLIEANPGLLLERKTSSVALHYRQRPDLAAACGSAVAEAAAGLPGLIVLPGKMVYELRPEGIDKGTAVSAFLDEAPFRGRLPVYAGDDLTDEHGFAVVNAAGGISIKIGEGVSAATYRTDRRGFLAWAEGLVRGAA